MIHGADVSQILLNCLTFPLCHVPDSKLEVEFFRTRYKLTNPCKCHSAMLSQVLLEEEAKPCHNRMAQVCIKGEEAMMERDFRRKIYKLFLPCILVIITSRDSSKFKTKSSPPLKPTTHFQRSVWLTSSVPLEVSCLVQQQLSFEDSLTTKSHRPHITLTCSKTTLLKLLIFY